MQGKAPLYTVAWTQWKHRSCGGSKLLGTWQVSNKSYLSDQHDEPAMSCNELSACQLRRRRHAENETAIDMSWYWSKRLKAMANWLLCLKARSYLTWPLSTTERNTLFSTRSVHCTLPPWIPMLESFNRCSKHAKSLDNMRSQLACSLLPDKEPMQQDLVFN